MNTLAQLAVRRRRPEIMDRPDLDAGRHHRALDGLARLNAWSGCARILWRPIRQLAWELGRDALGEPTARPLSLLDVACGSGDLALALWKRARRSGVRLEICGLDASPVAVEHARERAAEKGAAIEFRRGDALSDDQSGTWDVVTCSTFLHHLDEDEAAHCLARLDARARRLLLVNDLERSRAGWALAVAATRLLSSSEIVHVDGPRSVEGAFTRAEVRALADRAGLADARIDARFPCRWLLSRRKRA